MAQNVRRNPLTRQEIAAATDRRDALDPHAVHHWNDRSLPPIRILTDLREPTEGLIVLKTFSAWGVWVEGEWKVVPLQAWGEIFAQEPPPLAAGEMIVIPGLFHLDTRLLWRDVINPGDLEERAQSRSLRALIDQTPLG